MGVGVGVGDSKGYGGKGAYTGNDEGKLVAQKIQKRGEAQGRGNEGVKAEGDVKKRDP